MTQNNHLKGKKVLITRADGQSSYFQEEMFKNEATPIVLPLIKIEHLDVKIILDDYIRRKKEAPHFIIISSINSIKAMVEQSKSFKEYIITQKIPLLSVGKSTSQELLKHFPEHNIITASPQNYSAEGILEILKKNNWIQKKHFLYLGSAIRSRLLERSIVAENGTIDFQAVYTTLTNQDVQVDLNHVIKSQKLDWITFSSPSIVRAFFGLLEKKQKLDLKTKIITIGKKTSQELEKFYSKTFVESKISTIDGMIEMLKKN